MVDDQGRLLKPGFTGLKIVPQKRHDLEDESEYDDQEENTDKENDKDS